MAKAKPLKDLIHAVMTGAPAEAKQAREEIDTLWRGITRTSEKQKAIYEAFIPAMDRFGEIANIENQIVFIYTLQWPFLVLSEKYFERFGDFILDRIQSPSGKVRQAILHTSDWLGLSFDIWPHLAPSKKMDEATLARLESNRRRYFSFVRKAEELAEKYYEPKFGKYKYVNAIPTGIYKSIQYLITERLLRTGEYERAYDRFLEEGKLPVRNGGSAIVREAENVIARSEIAQRREEIERDLADMLRTAKSDMTLQDIKDFIYDEDDEDKTFHHLFRLFDIGQGAVELDDIIDVLTDAWNYFPHRALDGKSPQEMLLDYRER